MASDDARDCGNGLTLRRAGADGVVGLITMDAGKNQFTADFVAALDSALSAALELEGVQAVVTVGNGHIYSAGLNLE